MKGGVVAILAAVGALVASGAAEALDGELLVVSVPSRRMADRDARRDQGRLHR